MEIYNRLKLNVRYDIAQGSSSNDIVRYRTVIDLLEIDCFNAWSIKSNATLEGKSLYWGNLINILVLYNTFIRQSRFMQVSCWILTISLNKPLESNCSSERLWQVPWSFWITFFGHIYLEVCLAWPNIMWAFAMTWRPLSVKFSYFDLLLQNCSWKKLILFWKRRFKFLQMLFWKRRFKFLQMKLILYEERL